MADSIQTKKNVQKSSVVIRFFVISSVFLLGLILLFAIILPYIYTPPALTPKNLTFYKQCVEFVQNEEQYENLSMSWSGRISLDDGSYLAGREFDREGLEKYFSPEEITRAYELSKLMKKFKCIKFQRVGNTILFYRYSNRILPNRPGIAFAMDSRSPNEIDNDILNNSKPYARIKGDWYTSRKLILSGMRTERHAYVPESIVDCSLQTKDLDI